MDSLPLEVFIPPSTPTRELRTPPVGAVPRPFFPSGFPLPSFLDVTSTSPGVLSH
jgi:hypothetical protein